MNSAPHLVTRTQVQFTRYVVLGWWGVSQCPSPFTFSSVHSRGHVRSQLQPPAPPPWGFAGLGGHLLLHDLTRGLFHTPGISVGGGGAALPHRTLRMDRHRVWFSEMLRCHIWNHVGGHYTIDWKCLVHTSIRRDPGRQSKGRGQKLQVELVRARRGQVSQPRSGARRD